MMRRVGAVMAAWAAASAVVWAVAVIAGGGADPDAWSLRVLDAFVTCECGIAVSALLLVLLLDGDGRD